MNKKDLDILKATYKMNNIVRFAGRRLINEYKVGEHTFRVAMIAMLMVDHYNLENPENPINWEEVQRKALIHDLEEAYMGDIPSPMKKLLGMRDKLREVSEHLMEEYILEGLPEELKEKYLNMWVNDKEDETGEVIKLADKMEGLLVCYHEVLKKGNEDLKETFVRELNWFQQEENRILLKKYSWCDKQYQKIISQCSKYKQEEKQFDKDIRELAKKSLKK